MKDDFVMQPESFAKRLIEALKSKFKRELKFDYQAVIKTNDCCKPAIVVKEPNSQVGKTIYIEGMFRRYVEEGVEIEELADSLISICDMKSDLEDIITDELFQKMKDFQYLLDGNIMFKLINREKSKKFLDGKTYIPYLDFAVLFCMTIKDVDGIGTVAIPEVCSKEWGVSLEEAYEEALEVIEKDYPVYKVSMKEFMFGLMDESEEVKEELEKDKFKPANDMYIMSNQEKIHGSTVLLYKGELARFCDENEFSELYILPSSIHEVILISRRAGIGDEEELQTMVREVNKTQVQDHEVLSDNLYIYNRETDEITIWND